MPSKPLFGIPVVVGMSDAVMAMRSTCCAWAGASVSSNPANASAHWSRKVERHVVIMASLRGRPADDPRGRQAGDDPTFLDQAKAVPEKEPKQSDAPDKTRQAGRHDRVMPRPARASRETHDA